MIEEGPVLEHLTHRLAETPQEFLLPPKAEGSSGSIDVVAVVCDLLRDLKSPIPAGDFINKITGSPPASAPKLNRMRLILLASWLLADSWFQGKPAVAAALPKVLTEGFDELASLVKADSFVTSPERREEFCRLCLALLSYRPAGESEERALDQLAALSSTERSKVVEEARKAHKRAEQIRQAMMKKAAEEAAAKASRE